MMPQRYSELGYCIMLERWVGRISHLNVSTRVHSNTPRIHLTHWTKFFHPDAQSRSLDWTLQRRENLSPWFYLPLLYLSSLPLLSPNSQVHQEDALNMTLDNLDSLCYAITHDHLSPVINITERFSRRWSTTRSSICPCLPTLLWQLIEEYDLDRYDKVSCACTCGGIECYIVGVEEGQAECISKSDMHDGFMGAVKAVRGNSHFSRLVGPCREAIQCYHENPSRSTTKVTSTQQSSNVIFTKVTPSSSIAMAYVFSKIWPIPLPPLRFNEGCEESHFNSSRIRAHRYSELKTSKAENFRRLRWITSRLNNVT